MLFGPVTYSEPAHAHERGRSCSTSSSGVPSTSKSPCKRSSSAGTEAVEDCGSRLSPLQSQPTSASQCKRRRSSAFNVKAFHHSYRRASEAICPPSDSTPDRSTVVMALACFGSYIIFCGLAVRFPTPGMHVSFLAYSAAMFSAVSTALCNHQEKLRRECPC